MIVELTKRVAVPPPKEGPWRLPDHLDLPPAPPRTDGAPPWCFPDHTMLPDKDDGFVKNAQEPAQSQLLTETIRPVLEKTHPDGQFLIGQDLGIFWRLIKPPLRGALAPDWFYVPDVPPVVEGLIRRSYVMWQELVAPALVIEYASGDGSEERDRTPETGKFWIYEQRIRPVYYAIYEVQLGRIEVYELEKRNGERDGDLFFQAVAANTHGRFPIPKIKAELGIWQGRYQGEDLPWLRWWDRDGVLLPTGEENAARERERAEQERQRAEQEHQRAEQERERAERLAARLRALGVNPDEV